jgi:hypothetical protein
MTKRWRLLSAGGVLVVLGSLLALSLCAWERHATSGGSSEVDAVSTTREESRGVGEPVLPPNRSRPLAERDDLEGKPSEETPPRASGVRGRILSERDEPLDGVRISLVNLAAAAEVTDLGTITAVESRPFFYKASVNLTDASRNLRDVRVTVRLRASAATDSSLATVRFRPTWMKLDSRGSFSWACETPHPPVEFVLSCGDAPERAVPVDPVPRETRDEVIGYP